MDWQADVLYSTHPVSLTLTYWTSKQLGHFVKLQSYKKTWAFTKIKLAMFHAPNIAKVSWSD